MKKIFTLFGAGLVTLSVSAFNLSLDGKQLRETATSVTKAPARQMVVTGMTKKVDNVNVATPKAKKVKALADEQVSLEGTWEFALGDYYFQTSTNSTLYVEFEATLDGTTVSFEDPTGNELPFEGTYNEATGEISFARTLLGQSGSYYIYQEPFEYNYVTQDLDPITLVGVFDAANGIISFEPDQGISWPAYTNQAGTNRAGYFSIYDLEGAEKSAEWIAMENATFNENIIYSLFNSGAENKTIEDMEVLQNPFNPAVYKLINPLKTFYTERSFQGTSPAMTIDATDPDNVKVEMTSTGINGGTDGVYYYFNEGWYCDEFGDVLDPTLVCTLKKENGKIVITFPYHSFTVYASTSNQFYYGSAYESVLTFDDPEYVAEPEPTFDFAAEAGASETDNYGMDFLVTVTVNNLPEGETVEVYYKQAEEGDEAYKLAEALETVETMDVNSEPITTYHKFTISDLEDKDTVTVNYYAKVGEKTSAVETFTKDVTITGVENIAIDAEAGAAYYNLNGVRVEGNMVPGVYVKVVGKTTTKVVVK